MGKGSKRFDLDMLAILRALRLLRPVLRLRWWALALLLLLANCDLRGQGFSISLIIPLLASGTEGAQQNTNYWFARLFSRFSGDQRVMEKPDRGGQSGRSPL